MEDQQLEQLRSTNYFSDDQILKIRSQMRKSALLSSRDQKFISHDSINVTGEPGDTPL